MPDVVQGGMFGGLSFKPLGFDGEFGSQQAFKSLDSATTAIDTAKASISKASSSAGISGSSLKAATDAGDVASSDGYGSGILGNASGLGGYFVRGVVIILGFIFVAVGLTMFRSGAIVQVVSKAGTKINPA